MRRELGQLSLADGLVEGGAGRNRQLEKIGALVDWSGFEALLGEVYAAPVRRPSYGPVVLMKCLLLQQWYRLSDPGLEEGLSDRLSFRRLVSLALADPVPDHSTLSRFRSDGATSAPQPTRTRVGKHRRPLAVLEAVGRERRRVRRFAEAILANARGAWLRAGTPAGHRKARLSRGEIEPASLHRRPALRQPREPL